MGRYHELKELKNKYAREILSIEGVHAIGIRVLDNKIIVYCHDPEPLTLLSIPVDLETVIVDVIGKEKLSGSLMAWNKEVPINMPQISGGTYRYRPFPVGVGVGSYHVTTGTVGIPLWSRRLNKVVMVTNNHIGSGASSTDNYGIIRARCRQYTDSLPITIEAGGTPYVGNGLIETVTTSSKFTYDWNKPIITNISQTNVRAGDIITITGKSLGFRMGYSKVWFNDVQAKVNSWDSVSNNLVHNTAVGMWNAYDNSLDTDSTIQVYVPDGLIGNVNVRIEIEGDPILQPAQMDGGTLVDQIGQLEDYEPYAVQKIGETLLPQDRSRGDVSIFSLIDDNSFANKVVTHSPKHTPVGTVDEFWPPYISEIFNLPQPPMDYYIQGVQEEFCEKLPIMKVGRTTGTTFSIIYDPSYTDEDLNIGPPYPINTPEKVKVDDCVIVYSYWSSLTFCDIDGQYIPYRTLMSDGGDSGSSTFIASRQDYMNFMSQNQLYHANDSRQTFIMTNADFDAVEQVVPIEPMNFVGNLFEGWWNGFDPSTGELFQMGTDKAINWFGTFDVYPLELTNPYMQIQPVIATNQAEIVDPFAPLSLNLKVNAMAEIECWVEGDRLTVIDLNLVANAMSETTAIGEVVSGSSQINIGNIDLISAVIQPSNSVTMDLVVSGNVCIISGSVVAVSLVVSPIIVTLNLIGNIDCYSSIDIVFYAEHNLLGRVDAIGEVNLQMFFYMSGNFEEVLVNTVSFNENNHTVSFNEQNINTLTFGERG